jgi:hypothetical protein
MVKDSNIILLEILIMRMLMLFKQYAETCRVRFRIGNSSSQKRFVKNLSINIFIVFAKYEKSRDENGQETEAGGSSPPGGAGPLQAAPPCGETTPKLVSIPVSSCDFVSMFNFCLYNPPEYPRYIYRVFVVFSFRAISVRRLFSVLGGSWLLQATIRAKGLGKRTTKTPS